MNRILSLTRSRTGTQSEEGGGTSSGARDSNKPGGRFTTRLNSILAAGEEDAGSGMHDWQVEGAWI